MPRVREVFHVQVDLQIDFLSDDEQSVATECALLGDVFERFVRMCIRNIYILKFTLSKRVLRISFLREPEEAFCLVVPEVWKGTNEVVCSPVIFGKSQLAKTV